MKRFIAEHFRVVRPATAKRYYSSLEHFIDYFEGSYLDDITSYQRPLMPTLGIPKSVEF